MLYDDDRRRIVAERLKLTEKEDVIEDAEKTEDKARAYASLLDNRGWRLLVKEFIEPRLARERFLMADKGDLYRVQIEMKVLAEMLNFIDTYLEKAKIKKRLAELVKQ